jgi:hypothetical protein
MRVVLRVSTDTLKTDTRKMPKLATPLTDIQPRTAKPKAKPYKLTDGGGLFLLVNGSGKRSSYANGSQPIVKVCGLYCFG